MYFLGLGDISKCKLFVYSDASIAGIPDGFSSADSYMIFLVGENGNSSTLQREVKKKRRVMKSTQAVEIDIVILKEMKWFNGE